jgi:hypothetical protein
MLLIGHQIKIYYLHSFFIVAHLYFILLLNKV